MKKKVKSRPAVNPTPLPRPLTQRSELPKSSPTVKAVAERDWPQTVLFGLFLLTLVAPLVYSSTTFFGFITQRTLYFRGLVGLMGLVALFNRSLLTQSLSKLQASVLIFGVILLLANALGIDPVNSFLSGYSRMEGFSAYVHYLIYFLVLARAGFSRHRWHLALLVSVSVSVVVVLYGAGQESGWQTNHFRLVATIGNPSYLGLYLLLNLFLAIYLSWQFPTVGRGVKLALLAVVAGVLLWGLALTGTRSVVLGLGAGVAVLGIGGAALRFGWSGRTWLSALLILLILVGGFVGLQRIGLTNQVSSLQRLTTFSAQSDTFRPRFLNWKMAINGIAERPLLGWGQENYGYGFSRHYDPALLLEGTEAYDRTHNLLLEIGFSAGLIGLLAYGFIWFCLLRRLRENPSFSATDRVTVLALLAGYVAFNWLNFDSLVTAQVFFAVLALIDTPVAEKAQPLVSSPYVLTAIRLASMLVILAAGYYTVSAWQTLRQIDRQSQAPDTQSRVDVLETAYRQARVGQTDVADVLVLLATSVLPVADAPAEDKQICYERAVAALRQEHQKHPANVRLTDRLADLYATGKDMKQAAALYDTLLQTEAQRQPRLWWRAGITNLQNQQLDKARQQFQEAQRREPDWQLPTLYEALAFGMMHDTAQSRSVMKRVKTVILDENLPLVKSIYLINQDTTGLLNRFDGISYEERPHLSIPFFQEWALLAFEAGRNDQVSTALRSFIHSDGIWVNGATMEGVINRAKQGVRPDNIAQWIGK